MCHCYLKPRVPEEIQDSVCAWYEMPELRTEDPGPLVLGSSAVMLGERWTWHPLGIIIWGSLRTLAILFCAQGESYTLLVMERVWTPSLTLKAFYGHCSRPCTLVVCLLSAGS